MKRGVILLLSALLLLPLFLRGDEKRLELLFTSDLHSSADYLALYDFVAREREEAKTKGLPLFLVDAGDIAMGSLFHTLYCSRAFELTAMGKIGYDAFTVGNHDFDFGVDPFLEMLSKGYESLGGWDNPCRLTLSNLSFAQRGADSLFNLYNNRYLIISKEGVKVALFGLLGRDAYECIAGTAPVLRVGAKESAAAICEEIERLHNPDYIIALLHSGAMWAEKEGVTALAHLSFIVSGHDHNSLFKPLRIGKSIIGAAGAMGEYIGKALFEGDSLVEYKLIPLKKSALQEYKNVESESSGKENPKEGTPERESFKRWLDSSSVEVANLFYKDEGIDISDTVAFLEKSYDTKSNLQLELPLARHIARSYAAIAAQFVGEMPLAVLPYGTIREGLESGAVTYGKIFEVLSLGRAEDGSYGSPLVYGYVEGRDLKSLCELNALVARSGTEDEHLFFDGISYSYNSCRIPLTRVTSLCINGEPYKKDSLYSVVTDLYTARLLGRVKSASFGLLSVTPRNKEGKEAQFIILPVKGWRAFGEYLKENDIDKIKLNPSVRSESNRGIYLLYGGAAISFSVLLLLFGRLRRCRRA